LFDTKGGSQRLRRDVFTAGPGGRAQQDADLCEIRWVAKRSQPRLVEPRPDVEDTLAAVGKTHLQTVVGQGLDVDEIALHRVSSKRLDAEGSLTGTRQSPVSQQLVTPQFDPRLDQPQLLARQLSCKHFTLVQAHGCLEFREARMQVGNMSVLRVEAVQADTMP